MTVDDLEWALGAARRRLRIFEALLGVCVAGLLVGIFLQVGTNNLVKNRQHESCVSRRQIAFESARRQYVLDRFLSSAADTRMKLAAIDGGARARAVNLHAARYWKYRLLPMIHTVPIPPAC